MFKRIFHKNSASCARACAMPAHAGGRQKGITLIEVIIATFILLVAIVGSYLAFTRILMATSAASDRLVAAYLTQEGIEVIRNIRDTNWINGVTWDTKLTACSLGCQVDYKTGTTDDTASNLTPYDGALLKIDEHGFYTYGGSVATKFKRKITITSPAVYQLDVLVEVMWNDRGQTYSFEATKESLYNWK